MTTKYAYAVTDSGLTYRVRTRPAPAAVSASSPQPAPDMTPAQALPHSSKDVQPARRKNAAAKQPDDYAVGYAKPPQHSRFKKGQSGNPKGRPRGSINIRTAMIEVLKESVTVTENGRQSKISRPQALARQAFTQAFKGNAKFFDILLQTGEQWEEKAEAARQRAVEAQKVDPRDQELIDLFLAMRGLKPGDTDGGNNGSAD